MFLNNIAGIKNYPYFCVKLDMVIMPTLFELFGMRFFFYSLEHLPIHVHIENGDGRAKINVKTVEIVENQGIKPKDLRKAVQIVKIYQDDIIEKWNEYHGEDK